jgi:phospholipid transport system substrate-binding protein
MQQTQDAIQRMMAGPEGSGSVAFEQELDGIVGQRFGFTAMARQILGPHWRQLTNGEQREFVWLFRRLLLKTYSGEIRHYATRPLAFLGEQQLGDRAVVRSKLTGRHGDLIVEFRLYATDDSWKIYDVGVNGISLIENYRGQFLRLLGVRSYDTVLDMLRRKVCESSCPSPLPLDHADHEALTPISQ